MYKFILISNNVRIHAKGVMGNVILWEFRLLSKIIFILVSISLCIVSILNYIRLKKIYIQINELDERNAIVENNKIINKIIRHPWQKQRYINKKSFGVFFIIFSTIILLFSIISLFNYT